MLKGDEDLVADLGEVEEATARARHLTDDARPRAGEFVAHPRVLDLHAAQALGILVVCDDADGDVAADVGGRTARTTPAAVDEAQQVVGLGAGDGELGAVALGGGVGVGGGTDVVGAAEALADVLDLDRHARHESRDAVTEAVGRKEVLADLVADALSEEVGLLDAVHGLVDDDGLFEPKSLATLAPSFSPPIFGAPFGVFDWPTMACFFCGSQPRTSTVSTCWEALVRDGNCATPRPIRE